MKTRKFIAAAVAAGMLVPAIALAETSDVQAQIKTILGQIEVLQLQLKSLMASQVGTSSKPRMEMQFSAPGQIGKMRCIALARDLRQGAQGDDVRKLQEMLAEDPENGFQSSATGFFGPMTARAMMKFQMRMGISNSSDGSVGPLTRGFFERACGKGLGIEMKKEDMGGGMGMMRGMAAGTITENAGSTITIQSRDGIYHTIYVNASTTIKVMATATSSPTVGTIADLVVGKSAMAEGKPAQNGGITALMIKVGEIAMPMMKPSW